MKKFILLLSMFLAGVVMAIEESRYSVLEKSGDFELRAYEPTIVAETVVSGDMKGASGKGFRLIADYIFGNNTSVDGGSSKISMTAPVAIEPMSEKISMTAPVSMGQIDGNWRVQFVMPVEYTMATLPKPNNRAVTLREIPATHYAVITFSGFAGESRVAEKTAQLVGWLNSKGLSAGGAPWLARYNPPWTLPFLRRNEVMLAY